MSSQIIPVLALERCEVYAAQICALIHMEGSESREGAVFDSQAEILRLVHNLNRDIEALKSVVG